MILSALGAGGMGEVYRARDSRLDREVALKILSAEFAGDGERLQRFAREAQTLAALNHPHIAQIYGLEDTGDVHALVMELVEGEDLSARIGRGPIPIDEAIPIAEQIAEAIEAAHELGIVHRDLKPANVKVRTDGTAKVLDFGLAKALDTRGLANATALENSPTIASPAEVTKLGMLLGTGPYMSPEQARGKAVDKRSDIWAFGVVLYEMLIGRNPFGGDTVTDVLSAVISSEPDWVALPSNVPGTVRWLLKRCLERIHASACGTLVRPESRCTRAEQTRIRRPGSSRCPRWRFGRMYLPVSCPGSWPRSLSSRPRLSGYWFRRLALHRLESSMSPSPQRGPGSSSRQTDTVWRSS
jgi:serine/threonine protein kinase